MLSAIDQSFSVYFSHASMDIWLSSMQFKPTYVRLYSSVFLYKYALYDDLLCNWRLWVFS